MAIDSSDVLTVSDLEGGNYQLTNYSDENTPENSLLAGDSVGHEYSVTVIAIITGNRKNYIITNPSLINFEVYYSDTNNTTPLKLDSNKYTLTTSTYAGYQFKEISYGVKGTRVAGMG